MVQMSRFVLPIFAFALTATAAAAPPAPLLGFSDSGAAAQRALEARFDASLNPKTLRGWMNQLPPHPPLLGPPYDKQNADLRAPLFRSWGYAPRLEEFQVLFPTPKL